MTRIITDTYRYKRLPRKQKPVALKVPAITWKLRRGRFGEMGLRHRSA